MGTAACRVCSHRHHHAAAGTADSNAEKSMVHHRCTCWIPVRLAVHGEFCGNNFDQFSSSSAGLFKNAQFRIPVFRAGFFLFWTGPMDHFRACGCAVWVRVRVSESRNEPAGHAIAFGERGRSGSFAEFFVGHRCSSLSDPGGIFDSDDWCPRFGTLLNVHLGADSRCSLFQACAGSGCAHRTNKALAGGLDGAIARARGRSARSSLLLVCRVRGWGGRLGGIAGKTITGGWKFGADSCAVVLLRNAAFRPGNCPVSLKADFHAKAFACGFDLGSYWRRRYQSFAASLFALRRCCDRRLRVCATVSDFCNLVGGNFQDERDLAKRPLFWCRRAWWRCVALVDRADFYANRIAEQGISCAVVGVCGDGAVVAARASTRSGRLKAAPKITFRQTSKKAREPFRLIRFIPDRWSGNLQGGRG